MPKRSGEFSKEELRIQELVFLDENFQVAVREIREKWKLPITGKDWPPEYDPYEPEGKLQHAENSSRSGFIYLDWTQDLLGHDGKSSKLHGLHGISWEGDGHDSNEFLRDVATLCRKFDLWFPLWGHSLGEFLVTGMIKAPHHNFILHVRPFVGSDHWDGNRVTIELTPTTTPKDIEHAWRWIRYETKRHSKGQKSPYLNERTLMEDVLIRSFEQDGLDLQGAVDKYLEIQGKYSYESTARRVIRHEFLERMRKRKTRSKS